MDKSVIEPFEPQPIGDKPWGTELLIAHTEFYTGKVLYMNAGHAGGLQYHEYKDETSYLFSGEAWVDYDAGDGKLTTVKMTAGQSYHIPPGSVHRVEAITDCIFFEASNPVFDDRVNVGHKYAIEDAVAR